MPYIDFIFSAFEAAGQTKWYYFVCKINEKSNKKLKWANNDYLFENWTECGFFLLSLSREMYSVQKTAASFILKLDANRTLISMDFIWWNEEDCHNASKLDSNCVKSAIWHEQVKMMQTFRKNRIQHPRCPMRLKRLTDDRDLAQLLLRINEILFKYHYMFVTNPNY